MASFAATAHQLKSRIAGSNSAFHYVFDEAIIHRLLYAHPPSPGEALDALWDDLLDRIAASPIPHRPHRKEPRALKRRHKVYPYLSHPRDKARKMAYYDSTNQLHAIPFQRAE